jgi:hypothetical protein
MKLAGSVLIEVMAIIQDAMLGGKDASSALRELDLQETVTSEGEKSLVLTSEYLWSHPRETPPLPDGPVVEEAE